MKKIMAILFVYCVLILPSFAVITTEDTNSPDYIQNHGYSPEMSRLMDLQSAQINGTKPKFKNTDPAWYSYTPVAWVRKVFMYFDCGLDNQSFMQRQIKYGTSDDL